jgi:hypothetical protein
MSDFMNTYFGPLDKKYCVYFLLMSFSFFVFFCLTLVSEAVFIFRNYNKISFRMLLNGILILFNLFIVYFINRLFYTICTKSII